MKRITVPLLAIIVTATQVKAQSPDDALRTAWFIPNGTARNMGLGGAGGSLGGDISSANINPAGLGLYKTREFVFTPGLYLNNTKFNYRDSSSSVSKSAFTYGPIGYVAGSLANRYSGWTSTAFSISVTQLASYNTHNHFSANNNFSSFTEQWIEELTYNNTSPNDALFMFPLGSSLAYKSYLIDSTTAGGGLEYFSQVFNVPSDKGVHQIYDEQTSGGYHEISLGFAGNKNDRLYLGGSINIPYIKYNRTLNYREEDPSGNDNNDFNYFDYMMRYTSTGIGLNAKLGMIYKASNAFRFGVAFHTPSYIVFKDDYYSSISTDLEKYTQPRTITSDEVIQQNNLDPRGISQVDYAQTTPYKLLASGTYLITGSDLAQQKGFITADIEYVNYRSSRYHATDDNNGSSKSYYDALNDAIKNYNKGAVNLRLGGEMKFNTILARLGAAYYGSPYKDSELKASKFMGSAGIGYRNYGMFIDLTYTYSMNKDVYFPYRLSDKANTFAEGKNNRSNFLLTIGFKI